MPGRIGLVLNTTSVEHLLSTALPLACYFALNNKTIQVGLSEKSLLGTLTLESLHINTVSVGQPVFEQINGTSKLHVHLSKINIDSDIDGEVKALNIIPFKAQKVQLTDVDVDLVLESTSADNVHWQLHDVTKMKIGDVKVTLSDPTLNKIVDWFQKTVTKIFNLALPLVSKEIDN